MKKGCIIFLILNVLTTSALFVGGFILNSEEQESDKQSSTESSPSKDSLSPKDNLSYLKDETHFVAQEKQKGKLKTDVTYYLAEKGYTLSKNTEITARIAAPCSKTFINYSPSLVMVTVSNSVPSGKNALKVNVCGVLLSVM